MALVKVKDAERGWVQAKLNDHRLATFARFMRANDIYPEGIGENFGRMDARDAGEAESFSIQQLTYLEAQAIAKWYEPMRWETILGGCVDYSAGPQAKAVDYLVVDGTGIGRRISPAATDIPMVDVAYGKTTIGVAPGGIGYDYTTDDLRTSAFLKQPLSSTKQEQAVLAYKRHINFLALQGEAPSGFKGLYNNASVTAAPTASAANWNAATADTIVADILDGYAKFIAAAKDNERPSKIVFPLTTFQKLYTPRSTVSDTTIRKFIEQTLDVTCLSDNMLETLGSGTSTKRVVFCAPKPGNMVLHIPMPIEFQPPQLTGFRIVVPAMYKYGGFEVRRIQTVRYMDGV